MDTPRFRVKRVDIVIWSGGALLLILGLLVLMFAFEIPVQEEAPAQDYNRFLTIYEPSAAASLSDGRLVVVEDESHKPLHLLTPDSTLGFQSRTISTASLIDVVSGKGEVEKLDDLEGLAIDKHDTIYAISSHSQTESGKRKSGREKLIRFRLDGSEIVDLRVFEDLTEELAAALPRLDQAVRETKVKEGKDLNIEALGLSADGRRLLIGLRSPVIDDRALIVVVQNPDDVFEQGGLPLFAPEPWYLDLGKGGIRALTYDPELEGYLIVSRREDKKGKPFKLWFWSGDPAVEPQRVSIAGVENINRAEGITPIVQDGERRLLIVFDDGNRLRRIGGHYRIVDYADLGIE
ncbi:MAG: DUF3616 domain-containing protein [Gammaproteobacteria bacterium]|jgi:hypothetical protein